mgnify:CR=1 FL=1
MKQIELFKRHCPDVVLSFANAGGRRLPADISNFLSRLTFHFLILKFRKYRCLFLEFEHSGKNKSF